MKSLLYLFYILLLTIIFSCGGGGQDENQDTDTNEEENTTNDETNDAGSEEDTPTDNTLKRYSIKSGIIEFEVSGMQNGKETIYFDDYGMKEAKYSNLEMKMGGISQKTNTVSYIDGEWVYNYNVDTKTGTKIKNPFYETMQNTDSKDLGDIGRKMLESMGGEKIGSEEILGKTCEVWEIKNFKTKSWVWNNITLKTEVNMMGEMLILATKIEEGAKVDQDKLKVPEDVEFQDMSGMIKMP